jgi:hypothetical protein
MNSGENSGYLFRFLCFGLLFLPVVDVQAELKPKQARKALTRMAGFELTNGAIKIKTISETGATTAEVNALIRGAFRFEKDAQARWRVAEMRTGPGSWESIDLLARPLANVPITDECNAPDPPLRGATIVEPSVKRARCLLVSLLGIQFHSDAVRIQEVAPFAVPLASRQSTTVIAWIQVEARLVNQGKPGWQVTELRTGNRGWVSVESILSALNQVKRETARAELGLVAQALEKFRAEQGSYLVADKHSVVIDHLNPRYLARIIRVDPWQRPYVYQGQRDRFTLSSNGPDGKDATPDDIIVTGPAH